MMKKIFMLKRFFVLALAAAVAFSCKYDDADLWDSVDELDNRMTSLEEKVRAMNDQVSTLQSIVNAADGSKTISAVNAAPHGYDIVFSDGSTIPVKHGTAATAPVMGAKKDVDDIYYWTVTIDGITEFLEDTGGDRLKVSGNTPVVGVDAAGCWTVDCGEGPELIKDGSNQPIKAAVGEGIASIKEVDFTSDTDYVIFTLQDNSTIEVPRSGTLLCKINGSTEQYFLYEEAAVFDVKMGADVENISISKPDGWKASLNGDKLTVKAPVAANTYADQSGTISITAIGKNRTTITNIDVTIVASYMTVSFEGTRVEDYLAGPTSYGENLYEGYTGPDRYYGYDDAESDLMMMVVYGFDWETYDDSYNYSNGGIAISRWNDMTTLGYTNQCSVYYNDPVTGHGGNNGSQTFAMVFDGSGMGTMMGPTYDYNVYVNFADENEDRPFKYMYVNNTTYAVDVMRNGGYPARALDYAHNDWFKLTIEGITGTGAKTGEVEVYLADFRTGSSPGIMTDWTKVDLTSLGAVNKLKFKITGSDSGTYGVNTPAYFCFDDLTFVK